MSTKPDVAFIGLGAMGFGMATHLVKQGYNVTGFDVWAPTLARFAEAGGKTATTPAAAVEGKPVCVCMVATAQQAQAVLVDGDLAPAAAALPQNAVILLCSTVPCGYVQTLAATLADPNGPVRRPDLLLVDCPVSGGATRAADGTLSIMAGATPEALNQPLARTVLGELADPAKLYLVDGGIGAGSNTKMVHQVLAANQILSGPEAMGFAARLGLPADASTLDALLKSPGFSWMFGHRGPRMIAGFQPLASAITIIVKDTAIITSEARRAGFATPMTSVVENVLYTAVNRGYGGEDDSALLKLYTDGLPAASSQSVDTAKSLKLVVDLLKGIHLASAAESLAFAHFVGLDLDLILDLCVNAAGGSTMLSTHGPAIIALLRGEKPPVAEGADSLATIYENLATAVDTAQQIKAPVFLGAQALTLLRLTMNHAKAAAQTAPAAAVVKVFA
ncbi:hypothetical protein SBRCBS47491_001447 [Sporothrix bragantina]|uniref:3-hydroxyisobutyrate dehydrogenase n=1 Tax=Sporothrix bragantina TaxID=671064 RepID=A0ABP0AYV6_9PEZI